MVNVYTGAIVRTRVRTMVQLHIAHVMTIPSWYTVVYLNVPICMVPKNKKKGTRVPMVPYNWYHGSTRVPTIGTIGTRVPMVL
jgi:hypothetical protein